MVQRPKQSTPRCGNRRARSASIAAAPETDSDSALRRVGEINVFNIECPAHKVVARVGNKWTLLVLYALSQRTKRYTELQKQIGRISPKMLTQVLRNLEKDRLISRRVYPVVPPMVEYSLTPLGLSLAKTLAGLCVWADDNYSKINDTWRP
ncbi:helix-turn-helix transcriptional regulator [Bradyrhizobium sp. AUGA SZCCT0177]|uniref:winged helix-turn-helix transcriptional regulator n=1 Tax=Bradyrhizobium sp. AUGA SZCCT0177 TaxID=2807665 RepID=UPI001BAD872E|nr:helix-turn-helix domain-containing protein [Bradyrhizobium sp. AUGA SZCCT0177]MBR1281529.1 helix-turn-helix transcriptional regulator [Bradyrhizobium sp. AUGA SZCCT0177]